MSAMMGLYPNARLKRFFIRYNFKQIRDAVLLLFFSEKTNHFEKVFIYADTNEWETDVLRYYIDDETYESVCKKLQYLFEFREAPLDPEAIDVEKAVENYAKFLVDPDKSFLISVREDLLVTKEPREIMYCFLKCH
jgi:hypothetical protein